MTRINNAQFHFIWQWLILQYFGKLPCFMKEKKNRLSCNLWVTHFVHSSQKTLSYKIINWHSNTESLGFFIPHIHWGSLPSWWVPGPPAVYGVLDPWECQFSGGALLSGTVVLAFQSSPAQTNQHISVWRWK